MLSTPLDLAMAGLVLAYLLSLFNAVHLHQAVIGAAAGCFIFHDILDGSPVSAEWTGIQRLLLAAYLAALTMAVIGLAAALGWINVPGFYTDGQICSTLQYHNALAIYLAACSLMGAAFALQTRQAGARLLLSVSNYLLLLAAIGTLSRGIWLLYPLAIAAWIWLLPKTDRLKGVHRLLVPLICAALAGRFFFDQVGKASTLALCSMIGGVALAVVWELISPVIINQWKFAFANYQRLMKLLMLVTIVTLVFGIMIFARYTEAWQHLLPGNVIARAQQTSLQEGSLQERLMSYQNALAIIRDHPLTGTGGGGWAAIYQQYAQKPYRTKEIHDFYLKVGVEAGIIGLIALLAGGLITLRMLYLAHRQVGRKYSSAYWAAAAALLLMAAHAVMDFELSLPGVAFLFFALLGALRGQDGYEVRKSLPIKHRKSDKSRLHQPPPSQPVRPVATIVTIIFWGLGLAGMASCMGWFSAGLFGEAGNRALAEGKMEEARANYQRAAWLAPYTAQYRVGLATEAAMTAAGRKEGEDYQRAIDQAQIAARLEPYGIETGLKLVQVYALLQLPMQQVEECRALIKADPYQARVL